VVDGTVVSGGTIYAVTAAQLAQTSFVAGTAGASDDLMLTAYDGKDFSNHVEIHVNIAAASNHAPVLTAPSANVAATAGQTLAAASLFSGTDADGDALTYYIFNNTQNANSALLSQRTTVAEGISSFPAGTEAQRSSRPCLCRRFHARYRRSGPRLPPTMTPSALSPTTANSTPQEIGAARGSVDQA
jgi:hypothetical protein